MKKASDNAIGKALTMKPGSSLLACVGVNDFTPAYSKDTHTANCSGMSPVSFSGTSTSSPSRRISFAEQRCFEIYQPMPARTGPHDRLAQNVTLAEKEFVTENGQATGLMLLDLSVDNEHRNVAGNADVPGDGRCAIVTEDIQNVDARLARMRAIPQWVSAQKSYADFSSLVDSINMERTRYAFGFSAMAGCEAAKENIAVLIRQYN